MSEFVFIHEGQ